jgi:hypothetical protein
VREPHEREGQGEPPSPRAGGGSAFTGLVSCGAGPSGTTGPAYTGWLDWHRPYAARGGWRAGGGPACLLYLNDGGGAADGQDGAGAGRQNGAELAHAEHAQVGDGEGA